MSDVMACACTFTFFEPLAGTMLVFVLEPDADEFMLGIVISTGEDFYLAGFFLRDLPLTLSMFSRTLDTQLQHPSNELLKRRMVWWT